MTSTEPANVVATAHSRSAPEVLAGLGVDAGGLSGAEAARRLDEAGRNELPAEPPTPALVRFVRQFNDVLIYILLAAAVLKALMGDWLDFAVIVAVAVINALVGFIQEGRAE